MKRYTITLKTFPPNMMQAEDLLDAYELVQEWLQESLLIREDGAVVYDRGEVVAKQEEEQGASEENKGEGNEDPSG